MGTVGDWRDSIIAQGQPVGASRGSMLDWGMVADNWRAGSAGNGSDNLPGMIPDWVFDLVATDGADLAT